MQESLDLFAYDGELICGVDEAGRGHWLAGYGGCGYSRSRPSD
jgi:hypothetical protein